MQVFAEHALAAVRWEELEGAAGLAVGFGAVLERCALADPQSAERAAHEVAEAITSNRHLFPLTAPALPFIVSLLESPQVHCRSSLAALLDTVAHSASEANDWSSNLLAAAATVVGRHLASDMASHQAAARAVGICLTELRPRLEALAHDRDVGPHISRILSRR